MLIYSGYVDTDIRYTRIASGTGVRGYVVMLGGCYKGCRRVITSITTNREVVGDEGWRLDSVNRGAFVMKRGEKRRGSD